MNKDQIQGWVREHFGKLRAGLGKAVGNRTITWKGRIEQVIGKTQASYGDAKARLKKRL
ncbi:CsbD family protein [Paraburkholderia caffeinilytica]|uniref:CsbD family protein n=1 Tax=Paraburkholderia caffeinilytica TaxID=1761016 RepID=UPI0038B78550